MAVWDERLVFVDTNLLYYSVDSAAGEKHQRAMDVIEGIWTARTGVISTQVLSEWTVNLKRKLKLGWGDVQRIVNPYLAWEVVVLAPADPLEAVGIAERHDLSYWDSLIVLAARKARAGVLLTEDLNPGQKIEGVEVLNPL